LAGENLSTVSCHSHESCKSGKLQVASGEFIVPFDNCRYCTPNWSPIYQTFGTYLDGRVGEGGTLGGMGPETALRHVEGLRRVVEGPLEVLRRRKGIHFAHYFGRLVPCHSIDFLLIGPANWLICKAKGG